MVLFCETPKKKEKRGQGGQEQQQVRALCCGSECVCGRVSACVGECVWCGAPFFGGFSSKGYKPLCTHNLTRPIRVYL